MRLFKQQTGISPHAFVNLIRLRQAAVLLRQTADSILSVALNVGFQSETHFGKAFKKQYGISPGQYRKNAGIGETDIEPSDDIVKQNKKYPTKPAQKTNSRTSLFSGAV